MVTQVYMYLGNSKLKITMELESFKVKIHFIMINKRAMVHLTLVIKFLNKFKIFHLIC